MVNTEIRLIIFFAAKDREALYRSEKTRPGADCGSDHELLIAKFRLKLKKVGKTHVHRIGDAIQPSQPLSSPSPPAFNLSQHQGPFQ